jgi:hypothetical protein
MKRAIAIRGALLLISSGGAYAAAYAISGSGNVSAPSRTDGRREQLPQENRTYSKLGFSICEYRGADKIPGDIVARTPYRTASRLQAFLQANKNGFEALRRELNPLIYQSATETRDCFTRQGLTDGPRARIEWQVASRPELARASNFRISDLQGGNDRTRAAALQCFDTILGKARLEAAKTAENGPFLTYDGLYPGRVNVFFEAGVNPLTGPLGAPNGGEDTLN